MDAKTLTRKTIHRGRVFDVVQESILLGNGETVRLDLVSHPGAAAVVALTSEGQVKMLSQYRHALGGWIFEIPAGTLEAGEKPMACARRELAEEAGVEATEWKKLGELTPVPGYSSERIHLYLATGLSPTRQRLDRDELLEVVDMPFEEALEKIDRGDIVDAKTVSGILMTDRLFRIKTAAAWPSAGQ